MPGGRSRRKGSSLEPGLPNTVSRPRACIQRWVLARMVVTLRSNRDAAPACRLTARVEGGRGHGQSMFSIPS